MPRTACPQLVAIIALCASSTGACKGSSGGGPGPSGGDGPLQRVVSGTRKGDEHARDVVQPREKIAAGSSEDLACEVHWSNAAANTKVEATWWFDPAKAGPRRKLHGATRFIAESEKTGKWFVYVDTSQGWSAGRYACVFEAAGQTRSGTIVAE